MKASQSLSSSLSSSERGALEGRTAIVTGASRGIGLATARALVERGARVGLLARSQEPLREAARTFGEAAIAIPADVSDPRSVAAAFDTAVQHFGRLDVLVSNAGLGRPSVLEHASDADLRAQVETNLLGAVYCARAAIPRLRASGGGDIVQLSSDSVCDPLPRLAVYTATKAAVEAFARALREELRDDRIRVSVVRAGPTLTGFASEWEPESAREAFELWRESGRLREGEVLQPSQVAEAIVGVIARPAGAEVSLLEVRPGTQAELQKTEET